MSVRDSLIVNQNTGEEAKEIRNDVDKTGKSVDESISAAKEEILARVKEAADAGSSSGGVQIFTKNGTFIVPDKVTKILVTACAGGGGGGSGYSAGGGGGGGGAFVIQQPYEVTPGQVLSITIGKGGTGGVRGSQGGGGNAGTAGGATVIGNLLTLLGGQPGTAYNGNYKGGAAGNEDAGAGGTGFHRYSSETDKETLAAIGGDSVLSELSQPKITVYGFLKRYLSSLFVKTMGKGGSIPTAINTSNYYVSGGGGGSLGPGGDCHCQSGTGNTPTGASGADGIAGGGGSGGAGGESGGAGGDGIVIVEW